MAVPIYIHNNVSHTIFQEERLRNIITKMGIEFITNPKDAIILVAHRKHLVKEMIAEFGSSKKYLLWTHDPNFWYYGGKWTMISGQKIRTITVHSGEIYQD